MHKLVVFQHDFSLGRDNTHVCSSQIGNPQQPKYDTTKVHFAEPMRFIGVTYKNMDEGLFTEAHMTQRQFIPKAHPNMDDSTQSWGPGAHCTACSQLTG